MKSSTRGIFSKTWFTKRHIFSVKLTKTFWFVTESSEKIRRIFFEITKTNQNAFTFVFLNFAFIVTPR